MKRTYVPRIAMVAAVGVTATLCLAGAVHASVRSRHPAPATAPPTSSSTGTGSSQNMQRSPTGRAIQRFTAANMTAWSGTQADAVNVAKAYDVISAHPGQFGSYLPAMRAANPNLTVLIYMNGTFVHSSQMSSYPSSWFLHDSSGRPLHSSYNNYVMDPANSGWVSDRVKTCSQSIGSTYDGCMIDMLGTAPRQSGYLNGTAINPATNKPYTPAEWLAATTKIGAAVAQGVAPKIVVGNGLGSGVRYFDPAAPSSQLFQGLYGAVGEGWLKNPGASAASFPTGAKWKQNIDAMVDAGQRGRSVMRSPRRGAGAPPARSTPGIPSPWPASCSALTVPPTSSSLRPTTRQGS